MRTYRLLFVLLSVLNIYICFAQAPFPLKVGNKWSFHITSLTEQINEEWDDSTFIYSDTTILGKRYFQLDGAFNYDIFRFLKIDNDTLTAKVEYPFSAGDIPLFRFNAAIGESWSTLIGKITLTNIGQIQIFGSSVDEYVFMRETTMDRYEYRVSKEFGFHSLSHSGKSYLSVQSYTTTSCIINDKKYVTPVRVIVGGFPPNDFELLQNYPNPFNPSTTIEFSIQFRGFVFLSLYDILGNHIRTLLSGMYNPGTYEIVLDATDLPSGTYFYTLRTSNKTFTRQMLLLK